MAKAFIDVCRQMQMFTDVIVAIDGSKFKAVNSKPNNFTPQKAKDHIERVEQSINKYLSKLDESDKNSENDASSELNATKLAWLRKRPEELKGIQKIVEQQPDKQLSLTDPDSRLMKTNNMNRPALLQRANGCRSQESPNRCAQSHQHNRSRPTEFGN